MSASRPRPHLCFLQHPEHSSMKRHPAVRVAGLLGIALFTQLTLVAADSTPVWQPSKTAGVTVIAEPDGKAKIVSTTSEFIVDSVASLPAKAGDAFAIELRVKVGIDMSAQPEL